MASLKIIRSLTSDRLDWIILYNLGVEGYAFSALAHRNGTRVATEYCDIRVRPSKTSLIDYARFFWHKFADFIIPRTTELNMAISSYLEKWLIEKAPKTPTLIVPPLVDTARFNNNPELAKEFREKYHLGKLLIIAYLGSFLTIEGVAVLLKSVSEVVRSNQDFRLLISGTLVPGRDCDDVPGIIKGLHLEQHVILTGWLNTEDVIGLMSAANILVAPKTNDVANQAGLATKMAEYLSMGKAIIASNIGDVSLYLTHNHDCVLIKPGDQVELTNSIELLFSSENERSRLGKNARETAISCFDYNSVCKMINEVFIN